VDELKKYLERAETLGGKRLMGPKRVGEMGAFAMFMDPDGLVIGLFEENCIGHRIATERPGWIGPEGSKPRYAHSTLTAAAPEGAGGRLRRLRGVHPDPDTRLLEASTLPAGRGSFDP
jgi:hypothetical protein